MAGRPFRCRRITSEAVVKYFKPRGIPLFELEEVSLSPDELDAIRLADFDGLYQADAAEKMDISRQTFGNIISSAHKKVADALLNGKAICIEGNYEKILLERFECPQCGFRWDSSIANAEKCPQCENKNAIIRSELQNEWQYTPGGYGCRKRHRGEKF